jgi:hypothetical protein
MFQVESIGGCGRGGHKGGQWHRSGVVCARSRAACAYLSVRGQPCAAMPGVSSGRGSHSRMGTEHSKLVVQQQVQGLAMLVAKGRVVSVGSCAARRTRAWLAPAVATWCTAWLGPWLC